jgi:hypothetical protein
VKLSAIALDYDGTVARGDVLDPTVREAIALARTQGSVVLLVTGRILDELRRVADHEPRRIDGALEGTRGHLVGRRSACIVDRVKPRRTRCSVAQVRPPSRIERKNR